MISARPGARRTMSPLRGADRLRNLHVMSQGRMFQEVPALAVGGHRDRGPRPAVHFLQLVAAGMAGNMDARMITLRVQTNTPVGELVLEVANGNLIAGE